MRWTYDVDSIASPMTDAAIRSASATKSPSTSICACTYVENEANAEDAKTPGDTHIDMFPVIIDAALVVVIALMPHFLGNNTHYLLFFQSHGGSECS